MPQKKKKLIRKQKVEKNWTKIFRSTNPIEVEIIKQMLEENKITSIIMNQQDSAHNMSFGGHIDLYVQESSMKESIELLEKHGNERNF